MTDLAKSEKLQTLIFYILKTNMRVDDDGSAKDRIHDRVEGSGRKWSYC